MGFLLSVLQEEEVSHSNMITSSETPSFMCDFKTRPGPDMEE